MVAKSGKAAERKAQVSSKGRFKNKYGVIGHAKPNRKDGLIRINFNGVSYRLHDLILLSFNVKRPKGTNVKYVDGDPTNLDLKNLTFTNEKAYSRCTVPSKCYWARRQGETEWLEFKTSHVAAKSLGIPAKEIREACQTKEVKSGYEFMFCRPVFQKDAATFKSPLAKAVLGRALGAKEWVWYSSTSAASRALTIDVGAISACCRDINRKQTGGFEFKYDQPREPDNIEGEVWVDVDLDYIKLQLTSDGNGTEA